MADRRRALPNGRVAVALAILVGVAVLVRLYVGLRIPLDGDESAEGYSAVQILHGHLVLMESDGRYLGALDSYVLAPFVLFLGPTALAIRACFSIVGGAYVALVFALGRTTWRDDGRALLVAAIAGFFPLFGLLYGVKARTYGLMLPIEALLLLVICAVTWPRAPVSRRRWLLTGVVAGLAVWHHPLLAVVVAAGAVVLLLRAPALGWGVVVRGVATAVPGALVGWSPWLAYNLTHAFGSIRHLHGPAAAYSIPMRQAIGYFISTVTPIFVGARANGCGTQVAPTIAVNVGLLALVGTAFWVRRGTWRRLPRHAADVEPIDLVVLVGALAVLAVTVGVFNALFCEPRYTMPLALPLAFVAALALSAWWRRPAGRVAVIVIATLWLLPALAVTRATLDPGANVVTTFSAAGRADLPAAVLELRRTHPQAVIAEFALARDVQYLSGGALVVGEYGGYVGFTEDQRAALAATHPSWLFLAGDPEGAKFAAECARRGITYRRSSPAAGLTLYGDMSAPISPEDLGIKTQSVDAV